MCVSLLETIKEAGDHHATAIPSHQRRRRVLGAPHPSQYILLLDFLLPAILMEGTLLYFSRYSSERYASTPNGHHPFPFLLPRLETTSCILPPAF